MDTFTAPRFSRDSHQTVRLSHVSKFSETSFTTNYENVSPRIHTPEPPTNDTPEPPRIHTPEPPTNRTPETISNPYRVNSFLPPIPVPEPEESNEIHTPEPPTNRTPETISNPKMVNPFLPPIPVPEPEEEESNEIGGHQQYGNLISDTNPYKNVVTAGSRRVCNTCF